MAEFGVYIHIPFCAAKCDYCAFATWTDRHHLTADYLAALRAEIERAVVGGMPAATSLFVGGGTPSMVPAAELAAVIATVPLVDGAEVTVECNPDDVSVEPLEQLVAGGVNRVSLGVQSMSPHVLGALGRRHDPAAVVTAVEAIVAVTLPTFNLDIIYGGAGESLGDWRRTVDAVLSLEPPHVSAYGLTVEPGTALADDPVRHPDDDDQADKYEVAEDLLSAAGLANYEVSNWARPGHESRHNRLYWDQGDYRGFGCAAHSHRAGRRWWNVRTPERYIAAIVGGVSPEAAGEMLDDDVRAVEGLQLAIRTRDGVPATAFSSEARDVLDGLLAPHPSEPQRVVLTRQGRLLANEVAMHLAPEEGGS